MDLTKRQVNVWNTIEKWEQEFFGENDVETASFGSLEEAFDKVFQSWQPTRQKKLLENIDNVIFHIHSLIQRSKYDKETIVKVLDQGRIFQEDIEEIADMKNLSVDQLRFITNQHLAKQRLLSLTQGGIVGIAGFPLVAFDLPLILLINLRSIQMTALTYGYDLRKPYETMLMLKIFYVSTLPKHAQKQAWQQLMVELDAYEDEWLLFEEQNSSNSITWLQQPIKQLAKGFVLVFVKKKLAQSIPFMGMTIGATTNYLLAKQVSEISHTFYLKRYLMELKNN